jgi:hypothetical protein
MNDDQIPHFHEPSLTTAQVERLHEAVRLLDSVSDELDSSAVECKACGASRRIDWHQHQMKTKLHGVAARVMTLTRKEKR